MRTIFLNCMRMIPVCSSCALVTKLKPDQYVPVDEGYKCSLCFGLLCDAEFRQRIVERVNAEFESNGFDGSTVVIGINAPLTLVLREIIMSGLFEDTWNGKEMGAKSLFRNLIQKNIERGTNLRGSLKSELILTITLENNEFADSDIEYLTTYFLGHLAQRKRTIVGNNPANSLYTRSKIQELALSITKELASKYTFKSPSTRMEFNVCFEREGIYIGGRYCKFSRALSQSPWTVDIDVPIKESSSVSDKISNVMKDCCKALGTRFISSGREDIDVRMLGSGRPFAIQLINARLSECLRGDRLKATLKFMQDEINKDKDIYVGSLSRVTAQQAEKLNVGAEEKRKLYSAVCYSKVPITKEMLIKLEESAPITLQQNTVIRVLKRRSLHNRPREVFKMKAFHMDDYHFLLKLETQAGTYIKEFVHGDFGRTTPCVGDILGVGADKVDILELDVEAVELEWPPEHKEEGVNSSVSV